MQTETREKMKRCLSSLGVILLLMAVALPVKSVGQRLAQNHADAKNYVPISWFDQESEQSIFKKEIDLSVRNGSFESALENIASQSGIRLSYDRNQLPDGDITLVLRNVSVIQAFEELLNGTTMEALASPRGQVIIKRQAVPINEVVFQETVTGTVLDANSGETLPGVNIVVKGGSTGTSTNLDGQYEISVESLQDTLVFSYVGYVSQEVPINGQADINVSLELQTLEGGELVVVGYGSQSRETITGSISTVQSSEFNPGQANDPMSLISGKVAGLAISDPNSGDPNATTDFSLRGPATIQGNSQPLIVIDGVPGGDLQSVAPANIESIDVLKGGSAAAIYGSRATAGVIIVTTKKGEAGRTQINYSGSVSTDIVANKYEMLNADEYRQLGQEQGFNIYDEGANTDWFDAVTRTPVNHSHNLSVSGGNQTTTYHASLNFRDFQGIDLVSERESVNGTVRLETRALDDRLNFSVKMTHTQDDRVYSNRGALAQSIKMFPTFPVKNADGSFFQEPDIQFGLQWNPVASIRMNTNKNEDRRFIGSSSLTYQISPTLEASVFYSLIRDDYISGSFSSPNDFFQEREGVNGQASRSENKNTNQDFEGTLSYTNTFGSHNFDAIAGYSNQTFFFEGFSAGNNGFSTDAFRFYNLGAGTALNNLSSNANRSGVFVGSYASEKKLEAYFGRILYDYQERYLLNLSVRREGASVLGENNKWGTFAGLSGGWRLSSEQFMDDVDFIQNLKLRAGYGITGNQESLSPYQSLATIGAYSSGTQSGYLGTPDDGQWILPYGPTDNPNPALQWETKKEINIGLDFTLFQQGWLRGSIDYYDRQIEDLVGNFSAQLPSQIFPNIFANAGEMENKGVELTLDAQIINNSNFSWTSTFTGAHNQNKITSISSEQFKGTAQDITYVTEGSSIQRLAPGQPVAAFYGRVFSGFTEDGQWLFENSDGEAVPASEIGEDDFRYLGNSIPRYNLALTNNFNIGNFDFSLLIKSALDFKAVNAKRLHFENLTYYGRNNLFKSALDNGVQAEPIFSSYYMENGDYLKIKNLTLGYTFPAGSTGPLQSVRVYATGTNLATFTGFSGDDPELRINWVPSEEGAETSLGPGVESLYNYFPSTSRFEFGVNISF